MIGIKAFSLCLILLLSCVLSQFTTNEYETPELLRCPASVNERYSAPTTSRGGKSKAWCMTMKSRHNVIMGKSWGSMYREDQKRWDSAKCNELIKLGKLQTCDERYGWQFMKQWRNKLSHVIKPSSASASLKEDGSGNPDKDDIYQDSDVKCIEELKTSTFCKMKNIVIDFSRMHTGGSSRSFNQGFIQTFGDKIDYSIGKFYKPANIEGKIHRSGPRLSVIKHPETACDAVEKRPTFVMSNDDMFNIGHYINDVMAVWAASVLASKNTRDTMLLNIDGVRKGGPAGGEPHRLMNKTSPDSHGPYSAYYDSWFVKQEKGVTFQQKKVCFSEVYFQALPGIAWFWGDWGLETPCSKVAPSPLYQSFSLFLRRRWIEKFGTHSLTNPDTEQVHVIIELREINRKKAIAKQSSSRHIQNYRELEKRLNALSGTKDVNGIKLRVTVANFGNMTFYEQVKLSHSAGVLVSMHGAGTTHIFHNAIGKPNCCALVELFPDQTIEFHAAQGYGNLARHLGLHHVRYVSPLGTTTTDGTNVEIDTVAEHIYAMAAKVMKKPSCLHDVRDTRNPEATGSDWTPW
jgi:hypothetical protein